MMRKIILVLFTIMMMVSVCYADSKKETMADKIAAANYTGEVKTVTVILDAPVTYADNETIRNAVPKKAKEIFKTPQFEINDFDTTQMQVKIYREENGMITSDYATITTLKMADVQEIGKMENADYVLFLNVNNTAPRFSAGFMSMSFKTTITCDARVMDVTTGKYVIMKRFVKDGKSTAVLGGIPSFDKAYQEALEKALDELKLDTTTL